MRKVLASFCLTAAMASGAYGQDYPAKAVTFVVAFPAGGSTDLIGRYVAEGLSKKWGQTVVVENRPGAGSAIGSAHTSQAAPDGHTMVLVSASYSTNAATQTNLPFDPKNDLTPVVIAAGGQFALVAGPRVQATTVAEFIEEAKARDVFYATTGVGSSPQFGAELFNAVAGVQMRPVHYKGAGESYADLVGGRVDVYFGTITQSLPAIEAGQLKALAVTGDARASVLPDVPTLAESGVEGAGVGGQWYGIFVPSATPEAIMDKINADVNALMSTPEASEFLEKQGSIPMVLSRDETKELVHSEMDRWKTLAEERNIKAE